MHRRLYLHHFALARDRHWWYRGHAWLIRLGRLFSRTTPGINVAYSVFIGLYGTRVIDSLQVVLAQRRADQELLVSRRKHHRVQLT